MDQSKWKELAGGGGLRYRTIRVVHCEKKKEIQVKKTYVFFFFNKLLSENVSVLLSVHRIKKKKIQIVTKISIKTVVQNVNF